MCRLTDALWRVSFLHQPMWRSFRSPVRDRAARLALPVQLRLVCQPYNSVVVRILPPYVPSEREAAQPRVFAENVRRLFSQELRLPMVEQVSPCCAGVQNFAWSIEVLVGQKWAQHCGTIVTSKNDAPVTLATQSYFLLQQTAWG